MERHVFNHFFEVRFNPDPRLLDKRGQMIQQLMGRSFNQWRILGEQVEVSHEQNKEVVASFSLRNFIVISRSSNDSNAFIASVEEFIKTMWSQFSSNTITRLGVRSQCLVETADYNQTLQAFQHRFLKLSKDELNSFGGSLVDFAFPLHFSHGENLAHLNTGAMAYLQSQQFFGDRAFQSGVFLELDYFRPNVSPTIKCKEVIEFARVGIQKAKEYLDIVQDWVITDADNE